MLKFSFIWVRGGPSLDRMIHTNSSIRRDLQSLWVDRELDTSPPLVVVCTIWLLTRTIPQMPHAGPYAI